MTCHSNMPYLTKDIKSHCSGKLYGAMGDYVTIITDAIVEINGNKFPCLIDNLSNEPVEVVEVKELVPKKKLTKLELLHLEYKNANK